MYKRGSMGETARATFGSWLHIPTACLLEQEPASYSVWRVKGVGPGAAAKASLKRALQVARSRPETE